MDYNDVNAATNRAAQQAQATYYSAQAAGQSAAQALAQAQFAWQKTMDEAGLTGKYQGNWTMPSNEYFANTFGTWAAPTAGQQTLAANQQQFAQGQDLSSLYGQYYAPGTNPTQGQQTLQALQQGLQNAATVAGLTGYYNAPGATGQGQQTLAGQQQAWQQQYQQAQFQAQLAQQAQQNAQGYLGILANLRGPADWAKYQQVLGATPNGMRDLYAAAMGQYTPGGGATTGQQPQAANLNTLQAQVGGYYNPEGYQQNTSQQTWGSGIGVGGQGTTPDQQVQATGNGTNLYGGQQQQYNLPAPNQISAQAWNNFTPSQQQLMLGQYEAAGWDKNDVQALYNQSLPKYGNNNATAGTWRLQG